MVLGAIRRDSHQCWEDSASCCLAGDAKLALRTPEPVWTLETQSVWRASQGCSCLERLWRTSALLAADLRGKDATTGGGRGGPSGPGAAAELMWRRVGGSWRPAIPRSLAGLTTFFHLLTLALLLAVSRFYIISSGAGEPTRNAPPVRHRRQLQLLMKRSHHRRAGVGGLG